MSETQDQNFVNPISEFALAQDSHGNIAVEVIFTGDKNEERFVFYTEEGQLDALAGMVELASGALGFAKEYGVELAYEVMEENQDVFRLKPDQRDIEIAIRNLLGNDTGEENSGEEI